MDDVIDPEERGRGRVTETVGLPLVLLTELGLPEGLAPSAEAKETSSESESESSSPAKKRNKNQILRPKSTKFQGLQLKDTQALDEMRPYFTLLIGQHKVVNFQVLLLNHVLE